MDRPKDDRRSTFNLLRRDHDRPEAERVVPSLTVVVPLEGSLVELPGVDGDKNAQCGEHDVGARPSSALLTELEDEVRAVFDASAGADDDHLPPRFEPVRANDVQEPGFGVALRRRLRWSGGEDSPQRQTSLRPDTA